MTGPARWPSDSLTPPDGRAWDLLVIGGGTAGLVAAHTAGGFGASVLLVERDRTGGDCLWTGCVPSKSLLAAAHAAADARSAAALGVHIGEVRVDFAAVMGHVHSTIATIAPVDSPDALRRAGATVAQGTVVLTGSSTAEIDGQPVRFRQALLATGSAPIVPGIPGLAEADPLTSDTVWDLTELPASLLVLGGGAIGCELGQALARLGTRVTIVEAASRLLTRESQAASVAVTAAFEADGIDVRTGVAVTAVSSGPDGHRVELADGSSVLADHVLVAIGRRPRTAHLGLEAAGVELTDSGHVRVDAKLRTTSPRIWAAGDLTGHPPFTHTAGIHGSLAASNAVLGLRRTVQPDLVPRVTYTQPEVAAFGPDLDDPGPDHVVRRVRTPRWTAPWPRAAPAATPRWSWTARAGSSAPASSAPAPARAWPRPCSPDMRVCVRAASPPRCMPTRRGPTASGRPGSPRVGSTSRHRPCSGSLGRWQACDVAG